MAGPLPVRDYGSVDEMRAHAAALRAKAFAPVIVKPTAPKAAPLTAIYSGPAHAPELSSPEAREVYLASMSRAEPEALNVKSVMRIASAVCGVTVSELISQQRNHDITKARHISMYVAARMLNLTLHQIGRHYGDRDHTTVLNAKNRTASIMSDHGVSWSDDAVEMTRRLWAVRWRKGKAA